MADEIDFDKAASAFPDLDDIPTSTIPSGRTNFPDLNGMDGLDSTGGFGFDDDDTDFKSALGGTTPHTEIKITGDDEFEQFETNFPDLGAPTFAPVVQSSFTPSFQSPPITQQSVYGANIYTPVGNFAQPEEEEPEVIKEWRRQQEESIRARDEASRQKKQETIAKAEQAIDDFYNEYNSKKERNIAENKRSEAEYLSNLTDSLAAGTTWSRICDLVDLQNSQSKTLARTGPNTTDLTRFKEVLLRLKREGDNAPGAGGY